MTTMTTTVAAETRLRASSRGGGRSGMPGGASLASFRPCFAGVGVDTLAARGLEEPRNSQELTHRRTDGQTDELIWGGLGNLHTVPPGKILW